MADTEYISLLPPEHYDSKKKRYNRLAFKNSSAGGVSVIAIDCAISTSRGICSHIVFFYPRRLMGVPAAFWRFDATELPETATLVQTDSESGDKCHYDIVGITDQQCSALLKTRGISDLEICDNDGLRAMTEGDLPPNRI